MIIGLWIVVCTAFVVFSSWLLITLLILEIITFITLFIIVYSLSVVMISDFLILCFFRVFVIEGVIALAGLIILVSFSGTDYLRSSSILKC